MKRILDAKVAMARVSVALDAMTFDKGPGGYYSAKDAEARAIRAVLAGGPWDEEATKYLNKRLESAEYVGD